MSAPDFYSLAAALENQGIKTSSRAHGSWTCEANGDVLELTIMDRIGGPCGIEAKGLIAEITAAGKVRQINVAVNSPGGDVFEGFAIYNALAQHEARVVVNITGIAASAASSIAMAGDEIQIAENGMMMIHDPMGISIGDAETHREMARKLDTIAGSIADIYAARTGLSVERLRRDMAAETWMTARQSKRRGFVDQVVKNKGAPESETNTQGSRMWNLMEIPWFRRSPDSAADDDDLEFEAAVVPFKKYPLQFGRWEAPAAIRRLRRWASSDGSGAQDKISFPKLRSAFTWFDSEKPEAISQFKLPHHDVLDGQLKTHRGGVLAAGAAVQGSRGGVDIPSADLPGVRAHLAKHYREFDLTPPWERRESQSETATPIKALVEELGQALNHMKEKPHV